MELVKIQDDYEEYENLVLTRDNLLKQALGYQAQYLHIFGDLIYSLFKIQVICASRKRAISYCQMIVNRGETVDLKKLNDYLEESMNEYNKQLEELEKEVNDTRELKYSSEIAVSKSKASYRKIAKLIHPDINKKAQENEQLKELWTRAVLAHSCNDYKELEKIEVLVNKILKESGDGTIKIDIPDMKEKIEELKAEIDRIKETDPYLYKLLVNDSEAIKDKKEYYKNEIQEYEEYEKMLNSMLKEFVKMGVTLPWEENLQ